MADSETPGKDPLVNEEDVKARERESSTSATTILRIAISARATASRATTSMSGIRIRQGAIPPSRSEKSRLNETRPGAVSVVLVDELSAD